MVDRLSRGLRGMFWPSGAQEELLRVALAEPGEAAVAWRRLRPQFVLDELEPGSFELMPLVYRRLADTVPDEPLLERLKGVYRREWVRSNVLAERTKDVATALGGAGIRALFAEGAVLATRYYPDAALRTSWFVDALVEPADAPRALATLAGAGWTRPGPGPPRERWALRDTAQTVCVLRTAPAYDFVSARGAANEPLWDGAETYDLAGTELLVPRPTEALLLVCTAGARAQEPRSITWIVDAAMILRSATVEWDRLVDVARSRGQVLRLRDALTYLSRLPQTEVPEDAIRTLAGARVSKRERLLHGLASGSFVAAGSLPELTARHLAATAGSSALGTARSFPGHLRVEWETPRTRELPAAVARRALRRLRGVRM